MKKIIFYTAIIIISSLSFYNQSKCIDSIYVAPSELEDGWGIYCSNPGIELCDTLPQSKTIIFFFQVSPDGNWLFFEDDFAFKLLNLKTKEISIIENKINSSQWLSNSKEFIYYDQNMPQRCIIIYNLDNHQHDTICCANSNPNCSFGGYVAFDNCLYFAYPNGYPYLYNDSLLYRVRVDSSRKSGFPFYEKIGKKDTIPYPYPIFPPNIIHYYINKYPKDGTETEGFDVTTDFNYDNRREVRLNPPDTNWVFSDCNTYSGSMNYTLKQIEAGPRGEVYCYLSFRRKKDISNNCMPAYWDSSTIAARNASGWYRVDTNGNNLVQLVRSWTEGMGGISITADGNTIYYGMLDKDTNAAIYKMDRYGKNKELVINLGNTSGFTGVNEINDQNNNFLKSIVVNDVDDISLKFDKFIGKPATIKIYDILGQEIMQESYQNIDNEIKINVGDLPKGFYIIICSDNYSIDFYKMLKN